MPLELVARSASMSGFHSTRSVRACRRWMSSQPPKKNAHAGLDARPRLQRRHLCRFLWFYGDPDTRSGRCVGLRPVHASSHSTLGGVGLHADIVRISFYQDADVAAIFLDKIVIRKFSQSSTTRSQWHRRQRCQWNFAMPELLSDPATQ